MSVTQSPRDELASFDRQLAELSKERDRIEAQMQELNEKKQRIRRSVLWDILQQELQQSEAELVPLQQSIMEAVELFVKSLTAPPNYEEEVIKENGFAIPYNDTDDYADFTALETIIDDEINHLQDKFLENAANVYGASKPASEVGSRCSSFHGGSCQHKDDGALPVGARSPPSPELCAQNRRQLLLRLLFLTLHIGRLESLCHIDEIQGDAEQVVAAAEELKEEVAEMWQWVTVDHRPYVLSEEEREEWTFVLETYIGAPFYTPA